MIWTSNLKIWNVLNLNFQLQSWAHQALEKVNDAVVTQFKKLAEEKNIQLTDVNGKIIRRNLGQLIFGNKELVEAHEKIIFPEINRLIEEFAEKNALLLIKEHLEKKQKL